MSDAEHRSEDTPALGDAGVDRLLREAEALTREIAEETGGREHSDATEAARDRAVEDPLAALAAAEHDVVEISEQVTGSRADERSGSVVRAERIVAQFSDTDQKPSPPRPTPPAPNARVDRSAGKAVAGSAAPVAGTPRIEHASTDMSKPRAGAGARPLRSRVDAEAAPAESGDAAAAPSSRPAGRVRRLLGGLRLTGCLVVAVVRHGVAIPLQVLRLMLACFDMPFARLSSNTKNKVGVVAIITVFMGIAAWVLPAMFHGSGTMSALDEAHEAAEGAGEHGGGGGHGE